MIKRLIRKSLSFAQGLSLFFSLVALWYLALEATSRISLAKISGDSMEPSLKEGDRVLLWRTKHIIPGRLVSFLDPRDRSSKIIKRAKSVSPLGVVAVGDNINSSTDSRHFGIVPYSDVSAAAIYRYFPPNRVGRL